MPPSRDAASELIRRSLPPDAAFDLSMTMGAAGLDSLRIARIVLDLEEVLERDLLDIDVERLLTAHDIGMLVSEMQSIILFHRA